jgi:hypothetical protein
MIFQALGFNAFGMPANMDTLNSLVPEQEPQDATSSQQTPGNPRPPLSERLKQPFE